MSHADPGPLANYNSLQDKHLVGYFSNTRMKRQLKKSGLVAKNGKIIDEKTYRLNMAKKEHRKHVRDLLATAIVHKALDMERMRQYEIRKRLDDVYKVELVKRVKEGRRRKGDEDILPLLSPRERTARLIRRARQGQGEMDRPATAPSTYGDYRGEDEEALKPTELVYDQDSGKLLYRTNPSTATDQNGYLRDETEELGPSPYTRAYLLTYPAPAPPPLGTPRRARPSTTPRRGVRLQRFHYLAKTEPAVAHRIQLQSMAEVTMKFLGPSLVLTNSMFPEDRLSEVMVLQQHCGGSTLCVFRELLPSNTIFTFISRRHRGAPFGLTFYIDGLQDIRLSSCCEYKHKPGYVLGGKNGHFQFVVVEGAAPCYRCQVASSYSKNGKKKRRTSQVEKEDEQASKTFMTEPANDEEEVGETFDVIITKIVPNDGDEEDDSKVAGEMVDCSTQTPREDNTSKENNEEEKAEVVEEEILEATPDDPESEQIKEGEKVSGGTEDKPGEDKYDEDEFEQDEEKEKGKTKGESNKEDQEVNDKDDYNEDFETEDEKEDEDAEEKEEKGDEQKDESEDEIQDETEPAQVKLAEAEKEDDDAEEVEDETDEKNEENSNQPGSATDSEGRLSKSVSFDEDVTVIEEEQVGTEKTPGDVPGEELLSRGDTQEEEPAEPDPGTPKETADKEEEEDERILSPRLSDISSTGSSSSSSSDTSDSEGEGKQLKGRKSKKKTKLTARPSQDPGSDPDLVSTGKLPDRALKAVGLQPGTKHEGSVQPLLEGKEEIDLTGVSLTRSQVEEVASIVESRDYVGSVILRNTRVDDQSVEKLAEALKDAATMKMLNLSVNQIGPAGARHIAKVIKENSELRMLLLHGNPLTNEGVRTIVNAILGNPGTSVMNLDLGDCGVSDDGAKFIAGLITSSRTVSQLTISGNSIGINGWREISDALKTNTTLTTLSLDFNKVGDEEALVIAEGLRECRNLRSVDLEGNRIGDEGGRKLLEAVQVNKSIIDLTLMPVNYISMEILDEIKDVLEENVKNRGEADSSSVQRDTEENVQPAEVEEEEPKPSEGPSEDVAPQGQEHKDQDDKEEETVVSDTADVGQVEEPEWNDGPIKDTAQGGEEQKDQAVGGEVETSVNDTTDVAPEEEPDQGEGPGEGVGQEAQEQKDHEDKEEAERGVADAPDLAQAEEPDHSDEPREDEAQAGQEKKDQEHNGEAETVVSDSADVKQEHETAGDVDQLEKNDAKQEEQNKEVGEKGHENGEQPSGSATGEEEAGEQQNPPESVPQEGETVQGGTDAASEPSNVKDGPAESGVPPSEAEQPPSESRAQPSDTEEDLSEFIEQPNETKQEGSSEYEPSEERKEEEGVLPNGESSKEPEDAGTGHAEADEVLSSEGEKVDERENQENQPANEESIKNASELTEGSR